jgi:hypothetical protein
MKQLRMMAIGATVSLAIGGCGDAARTNGPQKGSRPTQAGLGVAVASAGWQMTVTNPVVKRSLQPDGASTAQSYTPHRPRDRRDAFLVVDVSLRRLGGGATKVKATDVSITARGMRAVTPTAIGTDSPLAPDEFIVYSSGSPVFSTPGRTISARLGFVFERRVLDRLPLTVTFADVPPVTFRIGGAGAP